MKILYFVLILNILYSCKSPSTNDQIVLKIEEKNLDISQFGFSSDRPFISFPAPKELLIFDEFKQSIVSFPSDFNKPLSGNYNLDQKFEFSDMVGFIKNKDVFLSVHSKFLMNNINGGNAQKIKITDILFSDSTINQNDYFFEVAGSAKAITSFHASSNKLFLLLNKNRNYQIAEIALSIPDKIKIHDILHHDLIKEHLLEVTVLKNFTLYNAVSPQLSIAEDKLLISYPFTNSFQYFELKNEKSQSVKVESKYYPNSKKVLTIPSDNLEKVKSVIKAWNSDVEFGPVFKVPQKNLYFRLVKGVSNQPDPFDGKIFISFFNEDFELVDEKHLNENDESLTHEYFVSEEAIYIKRKSKNEEVLSYMKIIVQ
jgi:hypothetical protein